MTRYTRFSVFVAVLIMGLGIDSSVYASEPVGELVRITGTAVVNQGAQYVVGREGLPLHEGDRLLVLGGGSALVLFADGCRYSLQDDELLVVPAVSTCASQAVVQYKTEPYPAIDAGPSISAGDVTLAQLEAPKAGSGASLGLVPAGLAATFAAVAILEDNDSDSGPPSP